MIAGVGTDIVAVARTTQLFERYGERVLAKLLAPAECADCLASASPGRFLAKRFAAKEALGKALGTGVRNPVLLPAIEIAHDGEGRPFFRFDSALAAFVGARSVHLSISDETEYAVAFVIVEKT
jgi:holo-[acyl-carrier protein] synthase